MDDEELSRSLVFQSLNYKFKKAQAVSAKGSFSIYCSDIAPWAVKLSRKAKSEFLIGRHPFMLSDFYDDEREKAAAVLLSAVIPNDTEKLSRRIESMRTIIGSSPYNFIKASYKIKELSGNFGIGSSSETLQKWCAALAETYAWIEPDCEEIDKFLIELERNTEKYEIHLQGKTKESYEEAVFWLCEGIFHIDGSIIPTPHTKAVWDFIRTYVGHYFIIGFDDCVKLFGFDYPAMIWYAAQGRRWLYETNYDGIYMMEHNLAAKMKRSTPMSSYERWRFRTNFLSKVQID